jgi:pSer/pThr/pTyr-binding forkhead associated (FHA) protein
MSHSSSVLATSFLKISGTRVVRLEQDDIVIGRGGTAAIVITDNSVSREHCRLRRVEDTIIITDLDSSNGTFINGERITAGRAIAPGDRVRIGSVEVEICDEPSIGANLRIISAAHRGSQFTLAGASTLIGRSRGPAEVPIDDDNASREHCRIACDDGRYILHDLGSRNGTLVNGAKVSGEIALKHGDLIQIGRTVLEFRDVTTGEHAVVASNAPTAVTIKPAPAAPIAQPPRAQKAEARPSRFTAFAGALGIKPVVLAYVLCALALTAIICAIAAAF